MTYAPGFIGWRKLWKHDGLLNMDWKGHGPTPITQTTEDYDDATLVGSAVSNIFDDGVNMGTHMPVLDIDFPAALVPSTNNYHLYLNKPMSWEKYAKLLEALYEAGIIQEGFYKMAIARGQTFVRRPGVFKKPGENSSEEWVEPVAVTDAKDPF